MKRLSAKIFDYTMDLLIDDNLTLVNGDSGVGKTLLFNYFDRMSYNSNDIYCFNAKYVERLKDGRKSKFRLFEETLRGIRNSLVIIDNADIILDASLRDCIVYDASNTYIIFGRNVDGLWITENNIATLVRDNTQKRMYLDYYFKDVNRK